MPPEGADSLAQPNSVSPTLLKNLRKLVPSQLRPLCRMYLKLEIAALR